MNKIRTALLIIIALLVMTISVSATPKTLPMSQKDTDDWVELPDGVKLNVAYDDLYKNFQFQIISQEGSLKPGTSYSFIYYIDSECNPTTVPGTIINLGTLVTDVSGILPINNNINDEIGSLPYPEDQNGNELCGYTYPTGAKIWVVPTSDISKGGTTLNWANFKDYVFEANVKVNEVEVPVTSSLIRFVKDNTAPTVAVSYEPSMVYDIWNNVPFDVTFTCTDTNGCTVTDPPETITVTGEGTYSYSGKAIDNAGNIGTGIATYGLDTTPPAISTPNSFTVKADSLMGTEITYEIVTSDAGAGIDEDSLDCSLASGEVFPIGTTEVTCTVSDNVGNTNTAGFEVTVESDIDFSIFGLEFYLSEVRFPDLFNPKKDSVVNYSVFIDEYDTEISHRVPMVTVDNGGATEDYYTGVISNTKYQFSNEDQTTETDNIASGETWSENIYFTDGAIIGTDTSDVTFNSGSVPSMERSLKLKTTVFSSEVFGSYLDNREHSQNPVSGGYVSAFVYLRDRNTYITGGTQYLVVVSGVSNVTGDSIIGSTTMSLMTMSLMTDGSSGSLVVVPIPTSVDSNIEHYTLYAQAYELFDGDGRMDDIVETGHFIPSSPPALVLTEAPT